MYLTIRGKPDAGRMAGKDYKMIKIEDVKKFIDALKFRGAWKNGVKNYAIELLQSNDDFDGDLSSVKNLQDLFLNGASDWEEYSWGGGSLIYGEDIAKRLCNNSELKKTDNGKKKPNSYEEWLDTQARALSQAYRLIRDSVYLIK